MGIYEVLKDLAAEMEKDCGKAGGICGDCVQQVQFYIRLIRLAVKMDESRPPIASPIADARRECQHDFVHDKEARLFSCRKCGQSYKDGTRSDTRYTTTLRPGTKAYVLETREKSPISGCCDRFANNQACSCLEDAE
jgi:hypothetical protein